MTEESITVTAEDPTPVTSEELNTTAVEESTTATVEEPTSATVEEPTTAPVKGKRIRMGRILFIIILTLAVLLLAGFALQNYHPKSWLEQIRVGSTSLPTLVAQLSQTRLNPSPTAPVNTMPAAMNMPGMDASSMATETPTVFIMTATQAEGVITVITMTPTANVPATATPTQAIEATATQLATVTLQPTSTLSLELAAPTATPIMADTDLPTREAKVRTDLQDLYQLLQASQIMMQTMQHGQPTEFELAAMKAQLVVVDQRMEKLAAALQTGQPGLETVGPDSKISSEHLSQILALMRQALGMVQTVLSGNSIESITFAQAQGLLEQIQSMTGQILSLVFPAVSDTQPSVVTATLTPTVLPSPTLMAEPTTTPTPVSGTYSELSQLQAMLSMMEEILQQMQTMLEQMQNQPGTNAGQVMPPGANNLPVGTQTPVPVPTSTVTAP